MIYLILLSIGLIIAYYRFGFLDDGYGMSPLGMLIIIPILFAFIIGGITYFESMSNVAEMDAFQNEVLSAYENTIDKSENIIIYAVKDTEKEFSEMINTGNLAYFELARSVNENIQQLRDEIKDYNNELYTLKLYNSNWFTDSFFYNVPEHLKPIKMQ